MSRTLKDQAVIVGIGQTEFSKNSGRSEMQLACEAVKAALDDCGVEPGEVDGLVTFTMDLNRDRSECLVLHAAAPNDPPVARISLPERISSGTHAFWHAAGRLAG